MLNISEVRLGALRDSKYIKPYEVRYNQNGAQKVWELIGCHASVAVVLFNTSRNVLVCVKQFRPGVYLCSIPKEERKNPIDTEKYPPSLGVTIEFCAGMMDKNKSPEVTAAEEVLEECGYQVEPSKLEKVKCFRCGVGNSGEQQILYYAEITDDMKVSEGGGVDDELIEVVELSLEEGKKLLDDLDVPAPAEFLYALQWFFSKKEIITNLLIEVVKLKRVGDNGPPRGAALFFDIERTFSLFTCPNLNRVIPRVIQPYINKVYYVLGYSFISQNLEGEENLQCHQIMQHWQNFVLKNNKKLGF